MRSAAEYFDDIPEATPNPQMIDIAKAIIAQQEGPFDPSLFTDRYEEALKALIAEKAKGQTPVGPAPEPKDTKVSDLMEALRASLRRGGAPASSASERKPGARKPASAPTTARRPAARRKAG